MCTCKRISTLSKQGIAHLNAGQHQLAVEHIREAISVANSTSKSAMLAKLHNNLGLAYQAMGQPREAAQEFRYAMDMLERRFLAGTPVHAQIARNLQQLAA